MKIKFIILFCIFSSSITLGQKSYSNLIRQGRVSADSIALEYYEKAFSIADNNATDLYNAACYATRFLENHDKAFYYLHKAIESGYHNVKHMEDDSDLRELRFNYKSEWSELIEKAKLKEEILSKNRVLERIKEYIFSNNSNALWKLCDVNDGYVSFSKTDVSNSSNVDLFNRLMNEDNTQVSRPADTTSDKKKMTFEEFSALIENIYTFTQENNIEEFEFKESIHNKTLIGNVNNETSSGVLKPMFNISESVFPSAMGCSVEVQIEKKDTSGFRLRSISMKTDYLEKDFDLSEYIKDNFVNIEDCKVEVFMSNQQGTYSFKGPALKEDIKIIDELKILKRKEEKKSLKVNELYFYDIINHKGKYVRLIFSENNRDVLVFVEGKSQLYEVDKIKILKTYLRTRI